ncbi:dolichyl-phosphate beta-glucosyltransferase [Gonapodya sp. JEL0774]|nr:dolichyl-phosphate beta-glucosyltransferase [Gonapodya sp. JEL0774]
MPSEIALILVSLLVFALVSFSILRAVLSKDPREPLPSELTFADLDSALPGPDALEALTNTRSSSSVDSATKPTRRRQTRSKSGEESADNVPPTSTIPSPDRITLLPQAAWRRKPLTDVRKDPAEVTLSVVVPSYNEEQRLPATLEHMHRYLEARVKQSTSLAGKTSASVGTSVRSNGSGSANGHVSGPTPAPNLVPITSYEILVVDDGSRDETSACTLQVAAKLNSPHIRVLTFERNRGKGGAVMQGFLHSRGSYIMFADADDAARFEDLELLLSAARDAAESDPRGRAVTVGSRAHLVKTDVVVKRSFLRNLLMYCFHTYLKILGISHIADTQCGFKLFTRAAAKEIFPSVHVEGWIFDVELIMMAEYLGIQVKEVAISWHEVPGSKMSLAQDSIQMALDLLVIRTNYTFGFWKVPKAAMSSLTTTAGKKKRARRSE